jgi:hypothetical protein
MCRELTEAEVRRAFLDYIRDCVDYWDRQVVRDSCREKMDGLVHSILTLLDGGTELPGFTVSPRSHPGVRAFCIAEGEDYYPGSDCDIAGSLHEEWYSKKDNKP